MATKKIPKLKQEDYKTSYFEFWPAWLFYLPMKLYAAYLAIRFRSLTVPTISNPSFDAGGFAGESKAQILDLVPPSAQKWFARHKAFSTPISTQNALQFIKEHQFNYPFVMKPDIGYRGYGVQIAHSDQDVENYIRDYPTGETIVIQDLYDYPYEVGVFYIRHPDEYKGHIFSLTLKYFPHVTGDGTSTLQELIESNPRSNALKHKYFPRHKDHLDMVLPKGEQFRIAFAGSHTWGTIFKDGNHLITDAMTDKFDEISKSVPEFYFGRYDVRFNTLSDLETGENMKIIEINGATSEATHIWDSNTSLFSAYKTLMIQYHHMFEIGYKNKKRGKVPMPLKEVLARIKKGDDLIHNYPVTH